MSKFEELLQQALQEFNLESSEKPSEWDGAILGSLQSANHYYYTRNAAFNDLSGAKAAKEEALKAEVAAKNAQQQAQEEYAKAEKAKVEVEAKLAELAKVDK